MNSSTTLNKKYFSSKQEKAVADALGWKVVKGSGSRLTAVGDVRSDEWLCECKTHVTPDHTISFNAKVWTKLKEEASAKFKNCVLVVDDGSQNLSRTWCMFSGNMFDTTGCDLAVLHESKHMPNINFKHDALLRVAPSGNNMLYECRYESTHVYIAPFDTFKALISGDV